jgi:hypothetical protein
MKGITFTRIYIADKRRTAQFMSSFVQLQSSLILNFMYQFMHLFDRFIKPYCPFTFLWDGDIIFMHLFERNSPVHE